MDNIATADLPPLSKVSLKRIGKIYDGQIKPLAAFSSSKALVASFVVRPCQPLP